MNKPHIKTLRCFPQVAAVIGEARAQLELWRVVHCKGAGFVDKDVIINSFTWDDSPQGDKFWRYIVRGINPYEQE